MTRLTLENTIDGSMFCNQYDEKPLRPYSFDGYINFIATREKAIKVFVDYTQPWLFDKYIMNGRKNFLCDMQNATYRMYI